ncbi:MAG: phosphatase PAP2 family protein [Ignavibacteria bacterium]
MEISLILLAFLFSPLTLYTQNQSKAANFYNESFYSINDKLPDERSDFLLLIGSIGYTLSSPFRWHAEDFIMLGGFSAVTAGSFLLDDETRTVMLKNRNKVYDGLARIGFSYGAPQYAIPGAAVFYLAGLIAQDEWLRTTGLMMAESLINIGIIQIPARIIAGRARPLTGEKNTSFILFTGYDQFRSSFISGHAAVAFSLSTILADQIDNIWATIGLYALAALTPLSRLYEDKHWLSDTVIGSAMGVFIANTVINYHKNYEEEERKLSIIPSINAVLLSYKF